VLIARQRSKKLVKRNKGGKNADIDFKNGTGEIEFDLSVLTKDEIIL
jgi:copper chaperone CopZ